MSDSFEQEFERYAGIHRLNAFFGIELDMEAAFYRCASAQRAVAPEAEAEPH